jgi:hypothetical protein
MDLPNKGPRLTLGIKPCRQSSRPFKPNSNSNAPTQAVVVDPIQGEVHPTLTAPDPVTTVVSQAIESKSVQLPQPLCLLPENAPMD